MPPSLDKPNIPGGVSESCVYNSHEECRSPRCRCSCHKPEVNPNIPVVNEQATPEKACPKCGSKRPFSEVFCRIDGERLASLLCGVCGASMEQEDGFCWRCSAQKGTARTPDVNSPIPTITINNKGKEVDYAKQVLAGIQREMDNVKQGNGTVVGESQKVVEQPSGSQGSFKIVDKPNPNKIRGPVPAGAGPQSSQPRQPVAKGVVSAFRLPIKP